MTRVSLYVLFALLVLKVSSAYHILVVFPLPGKSHSILGDGVVNRLLEAGHEVTYITPFPRNSKNAKLHEIDVEDNIELMKEEIINLKNIMDKKVSLSDPRQLLTVMLGVNNKTFHNPGVQKIMRDRTVRFDAAIVEWMFTEVSFGYAAVFNTPLIMFSSTEPHSMVLQLIDEPTNPAYVANILSSSTPPFSFVERVQELGLQILLTGMKNIFMTPRERKFYEETFAKLMSEQGRIPPTYDKLKENITICLGNSHVSLGGSFRHPQSYKPVGGYHIDSNIKPLPKELQDLLDSSKNGVIYFSMGSNLKSKDFPDSLKKNLLKMFGTLKYTVLWKFEEVLPDLPKNVHIIQWAPQPSILAHPNCILFITHGGMLSTTETVSFGKPIVGIPVFGDQFNNVDRAIGKGFAKKVTLSYMMADDLKVAIDEILSDPSYAKRTKELSLIYHDRPVAPGKELVHWVEHVIKTGGAAHLRSPALLVPWYQKLYLDFLALVVIVVYLFIKIIKMLCSKKEEDQKKKKN